MPYPSSPKALALHVRLTSAPAFVRCHFQLGLVVAPIAHFAMLSRYPLAGCFVQSLQCVLWSIASSPPTQLRYCGPQQYAAQLGLPPGSLAGGFLALISSLATREIQKLMVSRAATLAHLN